MTTLLAHGLASLFAIAIGAGTLACLPKPAGPRHWAERLSASYLLGVLLVTIELLALGHWGHVGFPVLLGLNAPLALAGAWALASPRARHHCLFGTAPGDDATAGRPREPWAWWHVTLAAAIGLKLAWTLAMNLSELIRTDDAFSYALALTRYVYDKRSLAGFVMPRDYPKGPGMAIVYFMLARGAWDEWTINLVYGNWLAVLLATFYGALRPRLTRGQALGAAYALSAMPMLLRHAVLAGYADLPMAALLLPAAAQAHQWAREGGRDRLALAIAFGLSLPMIKTEGLMTHAPIVFWTILLAAAWRRGRKPDVLWSATGVLALLGLAAAPVLEFIYGINGPDWLPPDAWNRIQPENHLLDCWAPLAQNFVIGYNNWQIVGTLVALALPPLAWARWRRADMTIAAFGLLELIAFMNLFALSKAFVYLQDATTVNRYYLQFAPVLLYACATLLAGGGTNAPVKPFILDPKMTRAAPHVEASRLKAAEQERARHFDVVGRSSRLYGKSA